MTGRWNNSEADRQFGFRLSLKPLSSVIHSKVYILDRNRTEQGRCSLVTCLHMRDSVLDQASGDITIIHQDLDDDSSRTVVGRQTKKNTCDGCWVLLGLPSATDQI